MQNIWIYSILACVVEANFFKNLVPHQKGDMIMQYIKPLCTTLLNQLAPPSLPPTSPLVSVSWYCVTSGVKM